MDRIDERLSRIEEELFDEFSEDELGDIKRDIEAYEKGELETITLEELKKELEIDDEL